MVKCLSSDLKAAATNSGACADADNDGDDGSIVHAVGYGLSDHYAPLPLQPRRENHIFYFIMLFSITSVIPFLITQLRFYFCNNINKHQPTEPT